MISSARPGPRLGLRPEKRTCRSVSPIDFGLHNRLKNTFAPKQTFHGFAEILNKIEQAEARIAAAGEHSLAECIESLSLQLRGGTLEPDSVVMAFASIRIVAREILFLNAHPEQLFAGWAMLHGRLVEMHTGEGKTLTAAFPAIVMALTGTPVHVITVNDYLVRRDAARLNNLYTRFGLSVKVVTDGMSDADKREAYLANIVYCTNKQIVFDYLRDTETLKTARSGLGFRLRSLTTLSPAKPLLRGLGFAIVDEADSVLIDDARVPLILAQPRRAKRDEVVESTVALSIARTLHQDTDFFLQPESRIVVLTESGLGAIQAVTEKLAGTWRLERYRNELVRQALCALHLYRIDRDYLVQEGCVVLIDESTGRMLPDRKLQHGLHRMLELKEKCEVTDSSDVVAGLSFQRFFQRYCHLTGMSGTLCEVRSELQRVYGLKVVCVPAHKASRRKKERPRCFVSEAEQLQVVVNQILNRHLMLQPVLVGVRTVELSEKLSETLSSHGIEHVLLNARQEAIEAQLIAQAGLPGKVTVATNMAGRGTDIVLQGESEQAGGLYVLNLEVNESSRVDRQLFGRAARQGDPGTCQSMLALTDECVTAALPKWLLQVLRSLVQGWPQLGNYCADHAFRFAQRRVERLHARERLMVFDGQRDLDRQLAISGELE